MVKGFESCEDFCRRKMKSLKAVFKRDGVECDVGFLRGIIKDEVLDVVKTVVIKEEEIAEIDDILNKIK